MQGSFPGLGPQSPECRSINRTSRLQHFEIFDEPLSRARTAAKSTKCGIVDSNSASDAVGAVDGERYAVGT